MTDCVPCDSLRKALRAEKEGNSDENRNQGATKAGVRHAGYPE
jgi:hypothetical protein